MKIKNDYYWPLALGISFKMFIARLGLQLLVRISQIYFQKISFITLFLFLSFHHAYIHILVMSKLLREICLRKDRCTDDFYLFLFTAVFYGNYQRGWKLAVFTRVNTERGSLGKYAFCPSTLPEPFLVHNYRGIGQF